MTTTLFLIFNHQLTSKQERDARHSLGIQRIEDLSSKLQSIWNNIPPYLSEISAYLVPIQNWLKVNAKQNDYVLVQGDFGACYIMVNFAFEMGLIPVYSTTLRDAVEEHKDDGTVKLVHQFNHQIFRKYGV
jgi:hypothetical protein